MDHLQSLGTARMALGIALVLVLGAIIIPLPQPARPLIAARWARPHRETDERDRRVSGTSVADRGGATAAATAPRIAVRHDGRTSTAAPLLEADRGNSFADRAFDARPTPLHPVDDDVAKESLPPLPQDAEGPGDDAPPRGRPRIELGPIDDTRARRADRPSDTSGRERSVADERLVSVNVVLNRDELANAGDPAAVTRIESRIESLQQRLDELSRKKAEYTADESRDTTRLLERVEQMVSLAEVQRKIDNLQKTIEETQRARETAEREAVARRAVASVRGSRDSAAADGAQTNAGAAEKPHSATPAESDSGESGAASSAEVLPRIRPGPPFAPTPAARNSGALVPAPTGLHPVRKKPAAGAFHGEINAGGVALTGEDSPAPLTQVAQAVPRNDSPESGTAVKHAAQSAVRFVPPEDDELQEIEQQPVSKESACYEYQLASRFYSRGDLMAAHWHARRAMAHDPRMLAAKRLCEQVEAAVKSRPLPGGPWSMENDDAPAGRAGLTSDIPPAREPGPISEESTGDGAPQSAPSGTP